MAIDDYFNRQPPALPVAARRWDIKRRAHGRMMCVFERRRDGLVFMPAKLNVFFYDAATEAVDSDTEKWDAKLHWWLVEKGVQCEEEDNESERFGYAMKAELEPVEVTYGDGFFNAVLIRHVRRVFASPARPLKRVLARVHRGQAVGDGASVCRESIDEVFAGTAWALHDKLKYGKTRARKIFENAIAYYLDERFNVTNRELLGFT